jgi:MYXO-CTERM domain-containing protein
MSFCGGMAGFASGFVRRAVGYHILAKVSTMAAGALLVAAYTAHRRRPAPAIEAATAG